MQATYGIDLRAACRETGTRRLLALVRGLPPRGALGRALSKGQDWSTTDDLLALIAELIDHNNRLFYSVNWKGRAPKPIQISRPYDRPNAEPKKTSSPEMVKRFFRRGR